MGGTEAKAAVNNTINVLTTVTNSISQDCFAPYNGSQSVNIYNSNDVQIKVINMSQAVSIDMECEGSVDSTTMVSEEMQQTIEQEAEALSKGFALNSADSETVMNLVTNLATEITNTFQQKLDASVTSEQAVNIVDSSGVSLGVIDMKFVYDSVVVGTMSFVASSSASTSLVQFLEEHSSATAKGMTLLLILIIVAIVFCLFIVGVGAKVILTPAFWFLVASIGVLVFGYMTVSYWPQWWPYDAYVDTDTAAEHDDKEEHNQSLIKWMAGLLGAFAAFDILMIVAATFMGGWGAKAGDPTSKAKKDLEKAKKQKEVAALKKQQEDILKGISAETAAVIETTPV
jgi:hypothetical protein